MCHLLLTQVLFVKSFKTKLEVQSIHLWLYCVLINYHTLLWYFVVISKSHVKEPTAKVNNTTEWLINISNFPSFNWLNGWWFHFNNPKLWSINSQHKPCNIIGAGRVAMPHIAIPLSNSKLRHANGFQELHRKFFAQQATCTGLLLQTSCDLLCKNVAYLSQITNLCH